MLPRKQGEGSALPQTLLHYHLWLVHCYWSYHSPGNEKILKNLRYTQGWFNGLNYIKGDVVRVGFGDKAVDNFWLCNDDLTCSSTQPASGQTAWTQTKTGYNVDPQNGLSYAQRQPFLY